MPLLPSCVSIAEMLTRQQTRLEASLFERRLWTAGYRGKVAWKREGPPGMWRLRLVAEVWVEVLTPFQEAKRQAAEELWQVLAAADEEPAFADS